jgi:hypothetical protein
MSRSGRIVFLLHPNIKRKGKRQKEKNKKKREGEKENT